MKPFRSIFFLGLIVFRCLGSKTVYAEMAVKETQLNDYPTESVELPVWQIVRSTVEQQLVTEGAKRAIDFMFPIADPNAVGNGSAVLGAISIVNGVDSFSKAKTDKQKGFAAAQTAVGVLSIAVPPAGAIAGLCLAGAQLLDTVLDIQLAARLSQIESQIYESKRQIIKSKMLVIEADLAAANYYLATIKNIQNSVVTLSNLAKEQCEKTKANGDFHSLKSCLEKTRSVLDTEILAADLMISLAKTQFDPSVWEVMESNQLKRESVLASGKNMLAKLNERQQALDSQFDTLNKKAATEFVSELRRKHSFQNVEIAMSECSQRFDEFISRAEAMGVFMYRSELYSRLQEKDEVIKSLIKLDIKVLVRQGDEIKNSACYEIQAAELKDASRLIQIQAEEFFGGREIFEKTRAKLIRKVKKFL